MAEHAAARRRIWGWYFFDWASQPFSVLLLTFIFAPYIKDLLGDGTAAQAAWGWALGASGLVIAIAAPLLGSVADRTGRHRLWVAAFSVLYVLGASALWWADPADFNLVLILVAFGIGLAGLEFATIFTNAMLPDLAPRAEIGRISGAGWAFGYAGGLIALLIMLCFFAENAEGHTLLGLAPLFGLDAAAREGTRFSGPFTALWYLVFIVPFFLWVRGPGLAGTGGAGLGEALRAAWPDLRASLALLPARRGLAAWLGASMLARDGLNGLYTFGGIYAAGVLGWSVIDVGVFGIVAVIAGALAAWLGGLADARLGPRPVIGAMLVVLLGATLALVFVSRESVFGVAVAPGGRAPDLAFTALGAVIGAAGGIVQAASRTMMVRQADPAHMAQAFGLYALAGKATAFVAPLAIGAATTLTGSQQAGILPLVVLFAGALWLLRLVPPGKG